MTLTEAVELIQACTARMDSLYGKPVFDEWTILELTESQGNVLVYHGSREADFRKNFGTDLGALKTALLSQDRGCGDFEFARDASGTHFDALMVVGKGLFLICNNTTQSIERITRNPHWLQAQIPFAELGDQFRARPVTPTVDPRDLLL